MVEDADWTPTTIYICQTGGRDLWDALESVRKRFSDPAYEPKPWPYEVNPICKCLKCKE